MQVYEKDLIYRMLPGLTNAIEGLTKEVSALHKRENSLFEFLKNNLPTSELDSEYQGPIIIYNKDKDVITTKDVILAENVACLITLVDGIPCVLHDDAELNCFVLRCEQR